jgi:hypothetical protein
MPKVLSFSLALALSACATTGKPLNSVSSQTRLEVTELIDMRFQGDSFFSEKLNLMFFEAPASPKYVSWAEEAVNRVNLLLPSTGYVPRVKIRLIFEAKIIASNGIERRTPISMIESYQEPKTNSIRIGMHELLEDKESFQLTIAHEYAHLVVEHQSRLSGSTSGNNDHIQFWPKSLYEGIADLMMAMALDSIRTAGPNNWSSKRLDEFRSLQEAREEKDRTVAQAKIAFESMGLIPSFPIYDDWLLKVKTYVDSIGGVDPYAEGRWFAGSVLNKAKSPEIGKKIIELILNDARTGEKVKDIKKYQATLMARLN